MAWGAVAGAVSGGGPAAAKAHATRTLYWPLAFPAPFLPGAHISLAARSTDDGRESYHSQISHPHIFRELNSPFLRLRPGEKIQDAPRYS